MQVSLFGEATATSKQAGEADMGNNKKIANWKEKFWMIDFRQAHTFQKYFAIPVMI